MFLQSACRRCYSSPPPRGALLRRRELRPVGVGFTPLREIRRPHDPKGEKLDQWRPVATADEFFLPAAEFLSARLVPNVIMGENYHTDIEDIMRATGRAGERGEALFISK